MTVETISRSRTITYRHPPDPALLPPVLLEKCAKLDLKLPAAAALPIGRLIDLLDPTSPDTLVRDLRRIQHPLSPVVLKGALDYGARWGRSTTEQLLVAHGIRAIAAADSVMHSFTHEIEALATAINKIPTKVRRHNTRTKPDGLGQSLVFPPPHVMNEGIRNLEAWLYLNRKKSAVLQAAVACQVLLSCHPLPDGNGRAARIVANALLIVRGKMSRATYIPLNEMFILALGGMDIRSRAVDIYGRWPSWIGWFCDVIEICIAASSALATRSRGGGAHPSISTTPI